MYSSPAKRIELLATELVEIHPCYDSDAGVFPRIISIIESLETAHHSEETPVTKVYGLLSELGSKVCQLSTREYSIRIKIDTVPWTQLAALTFIFQPYINRSELTVPLAELNVITEEVIKLKDPIIIARQICEAHLEIQKVNSHLVQQLQSQLKTLDKIAGFLAILQRDLDPISPKIQLSEFEQECIPKLARMKSGIEMQLPRLVAFSPESPFYQYHLDITSLTTFLKNLERLIAEFSAQQLKTLKADVVKLQTTISQLAEMDIASDNPVDTMNVAPIINSLETHSALVNYVEAALLESRIHEIKSVIENATRDWRDESVSPTLKRYALLRAITVIGEISKTLPPQWKVERNFVVFNLFSIARDRLIHVLDNSVQTAILLQLLDDRTAKNTLLFTGLYSELILFLMSLELNEFVDSFEFLQNLIIRLSEQTVNSYLQDDLKTPITLFAHMLTRLESALAENDSLTKKIAIEFIITMLGQISRPLHQLPEVMEQCSPTMRVILGALRDERSRLVHDLVARGEADFDLIQLGRSVITRIGTEYLKTIDKIHLQKLIRQYEYFGLRLYKEAKRLKNDFLTVSIGLQRADTDRKQKTAVRTIVLPALEAFYEYLRTLQPEASNPDTLALIPLMVCNAGRAAVDPDLYDKELSPTKLLGPTHKDAIALIKRMPHSPERVIGVGLNHLKTQLVQELERTITQLERLIETSSVKQDSEQHSEAQFYLHQLRELLETLEAFDFDKRFVEVREDLRSPAAKENLAKTLNTQFTEARTKFPSSTVRKLQFTLFADGAGSAGSDAAATPPSSIESQKLTSDSRRESQYSRLG